MPNVSAGQVPATAVVSSVPAVITRLITIGLVLVAGAVVISTAGEDGSAPAAQVAADSSAAVLVPNGSPAAARLRSVQRVGDAILLRVDPAGDVSARALVVSPGAKVTSTAGAVPLQRLLDQLADPVQGAVA